MALYKSKKTDAVYDVSEPNETGMRQILKCVKHDKYEFMPAREKSWLSSQEIDMYLEPYEEPVPSSEEVDTAKQVVEEAQAPVGLLTMALADVPKPTVDGKLYRSRNTGSVYRFVEGIDSIDGTKLYTMTEVVNQIGNIMPPLGATFREAGFNYVFEEHVEPFTADPAKPFVTAMKTSALEMTATEVRALQAEREASDLRKVLADASSKLEEAQQSVSALQKSYNDACYVVDRQDEALATLRKENEVLKAEIAALRHATQKPKRRTFRQWLNDVTTGY